MTNGFTLTFCTLLLSSILIQWTNTSPCRIAFLFLPIFPFTYFMTLLIWLFCRDPFLHDLNDSEALQYTSNRFSFVLAENQSRLQTPAPVVHVEKVTEVQHDRTFAGSLRYTYGSNRGDGLRYGQAKYAESSSEGDTLETKESDSKFPGVTFADDAV